MESIKDVKEDQEKRKKLENVKQIMELSGLDMKDYNLSLKKNKVDRVPLPPTVMLFQTFSNLASSELSPAACKVLFYFFAQTEYQNVISTDQFTIGAHVNLTERTVRRSIKELKDYGIINSVQLLNDKRRNEYFLNPYSSWKGSSMQRLDMLLNLDPDQMALFGREPKELKEMDKSLKM